MLTAPALPRSFGRPDLEASGFTGWRTWHELRATDFRSVPQGPAVYVVYRTSPSPPSYRDTNPGGRFKGKDPSVAADTLAASWVPSCAVLYIGKADVADRRLKQFACFGAGEPVGHWGGRYIWQLADSEALVVAWHVISWDEVARDYEKRLLAHFAEHDGARPFTNLAG